MAPKIPGASAFSIQESTGLKPKRAKFSSSQRRETALTRRRGACARCHSMRIRCSNTMPCTGCIRKGVRCELRSSSPAVPTQDLGFFELTDFNMTSTQASYSAISFSSFSDLEYFVSGMAHHELFTAIRTLVEASTMVYEHQGQMPVVYRMFDMPSTSFLRDEAGMLGLRAAIDPVRLVSADVEQLKRILVLLYAVILGLGYSETLTESKLERTTEPASMMTRMDSLRCFVRNLLSIAEVMTMASSTLSGVAVLRKALRDWHYGSTTLSPRHIPQTPHHQSYLNPGDDYICDTVDPAMTTMVTDSAVSDASDIEARQKDHLHAPAAKFYIPTFAWLCNISRQDGLGSKNYARHSSRAPQLVDPARTFNAHRCSCCATFLESDGTCVSCVPPFERPSVRVLQEHHQHRYTGSL